MTLSQIIDRIPHLVRFLALNGLIGISIGVAIGAALPALDLGGLGTLLLASDAPFIAALLYFTGFAVTFGSAVMASAVLLGS